MGPIVPSNQTKSVQSTQVRPIMTIRPGAFWLKHPSSVVNHYSYKMGQ